MFILNRIKRFLIARRTVLILFGLLLAAIVVGASFPQRFQTTPDEMISWQADSPFLAAVSEYLALDHVYTSPWFVLILALFVLALLVSTSEQIFLARRRTIGLPRKAGGLSFVVSRPVSEVIVAVKKKGYRPAGKQAEKNRFVKHPWGYWGTSLLHLGMLLVIVASLYIVLTRQLGSIKLAETEVFTPGSMWGFEERGLLAGPFYLSDAVRVDSVQPEFWHNNDLRQLRANLTFLLPENREKAYELEVNRSAYRNGTRITLSQFFGRTFLLVLTDEGGQQFLLRMDMDYPVGSDAASYQDFEYDEIPFLVKAKYYADAGQRDIGVSNPLLDLRLALFDEVLAELSLAQGQEGQLGQYTVKLAGIRWWVGLDFTNVKGIRLVFLGFFIIVLGVGVTYFMPPREILLMSTHKGCRINWYPGRFVDCYATELQDIIDNG